jgi:hypothetical protein
MPDDIEPISPAQARAILYAAIRERLGDQWDDPERGWIMVTGHDYMARLNRGSKNLDFYVDLLGKVMVEESELSGAQGVGRMMVWMLLGLSLAIALLIVRIAAGG